MFSFSMWKKMSKENSHFTMTLIMTLTKISDMVKEINKYLRKVCGSMLDQDTVKNVVTGEIVMEVNVDTLLRCIQEETDAYAKFMQD